MRIKLDTRINFDTHIKINTMFCKQNAIFDKVQNYDYNIYQKFEFQTAK